jgi:hypothetical protein
VLHGRGGELGLVGEQGDEPVDVAVVEDLTADDLGLELRPAGEPVPPGEP